jgi:hypothetical protein
MKVLVMLLLSFSVFASPLSQKEQKKVHDFLENYSKLLSQKKHELGDVFTKAYFQKYGTSDELKKRLPKLSKSQSFKIYKVLKYQDEVFLKLALYQEEKLSRVSEVYFVLVEERGSYKLNALHTEFSFPLEKEQY